jgi:hypothetical protein
MQTSSTQTAPKCNDAIEELVKKDIVNQETAEKAFKKLALTGVEVEYRVRRPGQEEYSNVEKEGGISDFEEALAKTIAELILARRAMDPAFPITVKGELLPP